MAWLATPNSGSRQGLAGDRLAGQVHEFALVARVNRVRGHGNNRAAAFLQGLVALDRPAFIPEQQDKGDGDQDQADQDALEGIADPAKPRLAGDLGIAVVAHVPLLR